MLVNKYPHVTKNDLARGERKNPCQCPVALALNRLLCQPFFVSVGPTSINICQVIGKNSPKIKPIHKINMQSDMIIYVNSFDNRRLCLPRVFKVEIPQKYLKRKAG